MYLIRKNTGAVLWHDLVEGHDISPAFFAESARKMLEKLPDADR
jgi:hypothetical protein